MSLRVLADGAKNEGETMLETNSIKTSEAMVKMSDSFVDEKSAEEYCEDIKEAWQKQKAYLLSEDNKKQVLNRQ